jgi:hypothetical protein
LLLDDQPKSARRRWAGLKRKTPAALFTHIATAKAAQGYALTGLEAFIEHLHKPVDPGTGRCGANLHARSQPATQFFLLDSIRHRYLLPNLISFVGVVEP